MSDPKIRIKVPALASPGELMTIKTMITHPMETGRRLNPETGDVVPRKIINRFVAKFNGEDVFAADLFTAVAANPYVAFQMKATVSGHLQFEWHDDDGSVYADTAEVVVGPA